MKMTNFLRKRLFPFALKDYDSKFNYDMITYSASDEKWMKTKKNYYYAKGTGQNMNILTMIVAVFYLLISFEADSRADWMQDSLNSIKNVNVDNLKKTPLSDTKIADGLREALKVGINNAVQLTGKTDGYFKNEAIKIPMPKNLKFMESGLRAVGFNQQLDDFILSMNRAAEAAAPQARDIFINAIMGMSFDDAMKIYQGGNTSATDYLKDKTSGNLRDAFLPFIKKSLSQYDVTNKYNDIIQKYRSIPFSSKFPVPDVDEYVLDKALDGLFLVLGQEETKIRTQPAARVTDLLKEVFKQ